MSTKEKNSVVPWIKISLMVQTSESPRRGTAWPAAKAVDVPYTTLRQWCQKQSAKESALGSPTSDKARVEQLEAEARQLRKPLRRIDFVFAREEGS